MAEAAPAPARLAEVVRSGFVESVHRGSLVVLGPDGEPRLLRGDATSPVFPRSANKLMQATGMVELGFPGREAMLALAAASHSGQPHHIEGVHRILAEAGLDESALRTPADYPLDEDEKLALVRAGGVPDPVLMNCSGKHAAMLATCVVQGWRLEDYRSAEHPLQRHLAGTLERLAGEQVVATGIDGCGAPVSALSLVGVARAYAAAVTAGTQAPERRVADAMRSHPEYVGGLGRDVTRFMRAVPGLLVKDGAEGVYAAALPDGRAFALKVDDGAERARPLVLAAWLRAEGIVGAELEALGSEPLLGGGERVGEIRVAADLFS